MNSQWFSWETLRMEGYSYICNTSGNYGDFNSIKVLLCILLSAMVGRNNITHQCICHGNKHRGWKMLQMLTCPEKFRFYVMTLTELIV